MKYWLVMPLLAITLILTGCATPTIRSDVTVFHEWPAQLADKSFVFERTAEQDNNLEYRSYETLVRNELTRLGFINATTGQSANLKVTLNYSMHMRDMKVVEPVVVDPYWSDARFYGPRWSGHRFRGPFYNPMFYGPPTVEYQATTFQVFRRQLKVTIAQRTGGKKLYDAVVDSEGTVGAFATVIPYMIRSAFADFPGKSGAPRRIELKMQE